MKLDDKNNVTDGITRVRDSVTGGRVRLANPDTMQHGDVLAPPALIVFAVICIGWMLLVLVRVITLEMAGSKIPTHEPAVAMAWAVFGFVLPAITANAIMMNWSSSRWLIILLVLGTGNLLILEAWPAGIWSADSWVIASVVAVSLCVVLCLFASRSIRRYYSLLAAKALEEKMD